MKKYWVGFMIGMLCSTSAYAQPTTTGKGTLTLYNDHLGEFNLSELRTSEDFSINVVPQGEAESFVFHVNCSRGTLSYAHTDDAGDVIEAGRFIKTTAGMLNQTTGEVVSAHQAGSERFAPGYWEAFCPHVPLVKN